MPNTIAINGVKLHEVRMPMVPYNMTTSSYMSYPSSQLRCSQSAKTISLAIPSLLALELYRIGILPQNPDIPVSVQIGRKPAKEFVVADVRYPNSHTGPFEYVQFTMVRVPKIAARAPPAPAALAAASAPQGA